MLDTGKRVALVSMPFISLHRPGLAIALLKSILKKRGIACDVYNLFIPFAERIGLLLYEQLASGNDRRLAGERIFSGEVFGPDFQPSIDLPSSCHPESFGETSEQMKKRLGLIAAPFLEEVLSNISWSQYGIVAVSTMFEQNAASLALARKIKQRWPRVVIVFGGANCEGEMGLELHRQFSFIDYVCSGEGDFIFPELVERLLAGQPIPRMQGLICREAGESVFGAGIGAPSVQHMDNLPYPDYDDYFEQLSQSTLDISSGIELPFETSRGCWYGAKQHCTFCGLNGATMTYRSKSPSRALDEIKYLSARYGVKKLAATDNILDLRYLTELAPELAKSDLGLSIFYEVKANMRKEHMQALKRAGIDRLQPGIESLSTPILQLMRKGCTALQNLQVLKWASEFQIQVNWYLLMGFPNEDPAEYQHMADLAPALVHLPPPASLHYVRLDRFSPYFTASDHLGMVGIRPDDTYSEVYPFPQETLDKLAYFFCYDYADGREPRQYVAPMVERMTYWQQNYSAYTFGCITDGDTLVIRDRRPGAIHHRAYLDGAHRTAFEFLDSAHSISAVRSHLQEHGFQVSEDELNGDIEEWQEKRWIVQDGDSYLALAVRMDNIY